MTSSGKRGADHPDVLGQVERLVALIATAVAIALHFYFRAHAGALWRDEVNTVNLVVSPSLSGIWHNLEFESFPVLFPLLLRAWIAVAGDSDAALRTLGLLAGLSIVGAAWLAALYLRRPPVLTLALLATNPEVVRWGSSVRAFGLGAALAIAALFLLARVPTQRSRWLVAAAGIAAAAALHSLYQNAVLVAAAVVGVGLAALLRRDRRGAAVTAALGIASATSLLAYVETLRRVGRWSDVNQSSYSPGFLLARGWEAIAAAGLLAGACFVLLAAAGIAAGVCAALPRSGEDPERDRALAFGAAVAVAIVGFAAFVLQLGLPTQPWYYLGALAFVAIGAEAALVSLRSRTMRIATVFAAMAVLVSGVLPATASLAVRQTNADAVAAQLSTLAEPGDLIVVSPWYYVFGIERYYRGSADVATVPPLADTSLHRYDLLRQAMSSRDVMTPVLERIANALRAGHRVFVVGDILAPRFGEPAPFLPPPPLPRTGWNNGPYVRAWSAQVGSFLHAHVTEANPVPLAVPGGRFEDLSLRVLRGWRP